MILTGSVLRQPFGVGSKSEHDAVILRTPNKDYVLRRHGGNPFFDPELQTLVGKRVEVDGQEQGYVFMMDSCRILT